VANASSFSPHELAEPAGNLVVLASDKENFRQDLW
jgi:hypothetical protein